MRHYKQVAVLGTFILVLAGWQNGNSAAETQDRLDGVTGLTCTFPVVVTGTWLDGSPETELDTSNLTFEFVDVDADSGTANAVGAFGPSHIITRKSGIYLHFMQIFNVGPLYTTTVFDRETREGKLMAVHTRHEFTDVRLTGFTSRPEQYYGECEIN